MADLVLLVLTLGVILYVYVITMTVFVDLGARNIDTHKFMDIIDGKTEDGNGGMIVYRDSSINWQGNGSQSNHKIGR
ncbi:hypothetical protein HGB24_02060 [Candidatus Saccharibacteria bacterium]|nr:hypothetical protein [Candidatus Saccharibacteria bacterium]